MQKTKVAGPGLDTSTRSTVIADWLRDNIVNGIFAPDTHLQEQVLADQTGTSRTPVREALKLLQRERLIVYSANRGYVVRRFGLKDILDAFDVRATLEGMVCRLVAERGLSQAVSEQMDACEAEMHQVALGTTWGNRESLRWFDLNFHFHKLLINEADNQMLADAIDHAQRLPLIFDAKRRLRSAPQVSRMFGPEDTKRSYHDHVEIIRAIRAGEAEIAELAMRKHISASREAIRKNFTVAYPEGTAEPQEQLG